MIAVTAATGKTGRAIIQDSATAGLPIRAVLHSEGRRSTASEDGAADAVVADDRLLTQPPWIGVVSMSELALRPTSSVQA